MAENGTIKISDISELYSLLPEELRQEFEIGIHGFSDRNYGLTQIDNEKIQQAKDGILRDGLKIRGDRKLLSTVKFGEWMENDYIIQNGYPAGVIVALPKVLRSESGEEIFIGSPVEDKRARLRNGWDRNRQATSLSEVILPSNGTLDSIFIIGTYTKSEKGIEVVLNPNHIAFNKGKVPDGFFQDRYSKLTNLELDGLDNEVIEETMSQQQDYKGNLNSSIDLRTIERKKVVKEAQALMDYLSVHSQDGELSQEDIDLILGDLTQLRTMGLDDMADTIKTLAEKVRIKDERKDERIERLSMAIAEMREAGIDDRTIVGMLEGDIRKGTIPVSDMEELIVMNRVFKKYGIDDIKKEDYASHDNQQSGEMKTIIAELMQPQEEKVDGVEVANEQTGISQEKVDKISTAIEEMRAAGLDDDLITMFMIKGVRGKLVRPEQLSIIS